MKLEGIIDGLENVIGRVSDMKSKSDAGVAKAIGIVASRLRDVAKTYAVAGHPENPNRISGRLRDSIRYWMIDNNHARVASDADYAPYVEFGHSQTPGRFVPAIGRRLVASEVKPYPYFRPAMTQVFDGGEAKTLFTESLSESLAK